MFKTDKKSLEELSLILSERDVANLKKTLDYAHSRSLLSVSIEEYQRIIKSFDEIGKLKLDGKIYAFHVYDNYAEEHCNSGVELYIRHGDTLNDFFIPNLRDRVYTSTEAIEYLKEKGKEEIYTGVICDIFLGLDSSCDDEHPIIRDVLESTEISDFESEGIKVITLETLI